MTGKGIPLEEFDLGAAPRPSAAQAAEGALAEAQLAGFDKGYREGWEDAARAHAAEQAAIGADLARALEDMSFTYHEARSAMLGEMRGLIHGLVEKVLPRSAQAALGAMILQQLEDAAKARSEVSVVITLAPGNRARIAPLLQAEAPIPVQLAEEPSLGPGQAALRFASAEEAVDLDAVLAGIAAAVDGFFETEARGADAPPAPKDSP